MRIAFQMEPLEETNRLETHTLLLMQEAQDRGHEPWQFHPREVSLLGSKVLATARPVTLHLDRDPHFTYGAEKTVDLSTFDVILIRQDPPFNMEYITSTYLLELVCPKTVVVNDPKAIRDFPEKVYPFRFAKYMPPTLVTYSQQAVDDFRAEQGDVVVKPLYGFHGHGVAHIRAEDGYILPDNLMEPLMFQKYLPEVKAGNKRVVFIDGKVDKAIVTVPPEGEFRVYRDSTDHAYELTPREQKLCADIGLDLKKQGLLFVGIDMIGDYLTEINVTSVGSIRRINAIYGGKCEARVWDAIERRL